MSARPYRLLALVKQDAVVRVQKEPDDTVMTWPHLLTIEFLAAGVMSIFLLLMGLFINAPLEELANGNVTPAVAKAPWYFLGLQELLAYFHPTVAGVLVPTFVLVGAALIPYVDRGDILATRPSRRKTAVLLFTLFCVLGLVLTFVGIFFRGPGYTFVIPFVHRPRRVLLPVTTEDPSEHEQLPRRTRRQARGPDQGGHQVAAQAAGPGPVAPSAHARRHRRRVRPVAARGLRRHDRLHLAEPLGRLRGADPRSGRSTTSRPQNSTLPIDEGFPAYFAERALVRHPRRSGAAALRRRARTRPATARRSTSARCTSAARTSAASRTRASRTSGSSVRATDRATTGSGSRPTARSSARRRAAWTASRSRSTARARSPSTPARSPWDRFPWPSDSPGIIPPRTPTGCI